MTCKDCLHYGVCNCIGNIALPCADFQDKSEWVHLPCKVGDTAYILGRNLLKGANAWYIEKITIAVVDMERSALGTDCCIQAECELIGGYLGATVFLTKEEAEKALAERRKEKREWKMINTQQQT